MVKNSVLFSNEDFENMNTFMNSKMYGRMVLCTIYTKKKHYAHVL